MVKIESSQREGVYQLSGGPAVRVFALPVLPGCLWLANSSRHHLFPAGFVESLVRSLQ